MEFVESVKLFNEISGTKEEYNIRKVGLYTSLVLEEVGEMIEAIGMKESQLFSILDHYRKAFKEAMYDELIESTMKDVDKRIEYLDSCADIAVVAIGSGIAIGSDISGALSAVAENNLSKFPIVDGKHTVLYDTNGKVMKPSNFQSVKLDEFIKGI